ncbi:lipid-A-disaccharide synthase [Synergistales bacterium]|nr:lipid-A-disaccharide synthase [Synergistales bacterium]
MNQTVSYDSEKTLFVSAGEVSGDHYIARVAELLRLRGFGGRICGLCGLESRTSGVEALWANERLHVMGFSEILGAARGILRLARDMLRTILNMRPDALLVADSPDFHLPLIRRLRKNGYKGAIFYISPPSVWAWRSGRVKDLRAHVDENLPLFAFEHEYLEKELAASHWIGHPLIDDVKAGNPDTGRIIGGIVSKNAPPAGDWIVALFPGSRKSEITQLYPVLSGVYGSLERRGFSPVFSVARGLSEGARSYLTAQVEASGQSYYDGSGRDLMSASKAIAGSSGTATIEALMLERFMVVMYKVKPVSALIGRLILRNRFFAAPNLLAGEEFFPELMQDRATARNAVSALLAYLGASASEKSSITQRMRELRGAMGRPGAYGFWAGRISEVLR